MSDSNDPHRRNQLRMLAPLFLIGGLSLFAAPLFHPNNTCKDWLEKWGQLAMQSIWVPIHQVASFGFAVGTGSAMLLCLVGPRRRSGFIGGAFFAAGFGMMAMLTVMHATAVSVMGKAFNESANAAERQMFRTIASAFVSYDVAAEGVAAVLISAGAVTLAYYLWQIGLVSKPAALVLAGDGAIWGVQYYRLLHIIHYSFPEWVPYVSLGLWLCAAAVLLHTQVSRHVPGADAVAEAGAT